jgi:hypothetical protein
MASRTSAVRSFIVALALLGCRTATPPVDVDVNTDAAPPRTDAATPKAYPGLVGHWRFDERGGGVAADSSPSGNAGTLKGGALLAAGGFPKARFANPGALVLDGVDGRVALETKGLPQGARTISLWMTYVAAPAGVHQLLSLTGAGCGVQLGLRDNRLAASAGATELVGVAAPKPGWHHIVYTATGMSHTLTIDGVRAPSTTAAAQACTITEALVGNSAAGTEGFQGSVDDLRIYDRVLTDSEIGSLAQGDDPAVTPPGDGGLPPPADGPLARDAGPTTDAGVTGPLAENLVGYWPLDEGMGTTTADLSGSLNGGTLVGMTTWTAGGFPAAKFANPFSLTLNGNGDQVNVGVNRLPAISQSMSVSLWFSYATQPTTGNRTFFSFTNRAETCGIQIGTRAANLSVWLWGGMVHVATPAPPPGWHHVVYTFDGNTHSVYLDGAAPLTSDTPTQSCFPTDAIIGNYQGGKEYFIGQIDDVRIWADRTLTPADVAKLYAGEQ